VTSESSVAVTTSQKISLAIEECLECLTVIVGIAAYKFDGDATAFL
jgi:hypothetical protein